jgi:hypothetical protein
VAENVSDVFLGIEIPSGAAHRRLLKLCKWSRIATVIRHFKSGNIANQGGTAGVVLSSLGQKNNFFIVKEWQIWI